MAKNLQKRKSIVDQVFGFKLYPVIDDRGEMIRFQFSQATVNDREALKNKCFH
jgi:hypothetical protein